MSKTIRGECLHCSVKIDILPFGYVDEFDTKEQPHLVVGEPLIDYNERFCPPCNKGRLNRRERAQGYLSDVPPAWFSPADAGECWHEDDY